MVRMIPDSRSASSHAARSTRSARISTPGLFTGLGVLAAVILFAAVAACDPTTGVDSEPPEVTITAPLSDARFEQSDTITFMGSATDPEDGPLPASALIWKSSLDSTLGTGEELAVAASELTAGTHEVTLAATDSDGVTGSASITIVVIQAPQ